MISGLLISSASLLGYIFSVHYWLRVPFRLSPLLCFGSLIIFLFWAALAEVLLPVTILLLSFGVFLCLVIVILRIRGNTIVMDNTARDSLLLFLGLAALAFICGLVGRPSVIDDYAYWAIISKSIQMFDGLPTSDTTIFARHLTYTPGLALFQYYFFTAFSDYNISAAYLAQNLFLTSLLFALTDQLDRKASLTVMGMAVIILILFSGSVFQKLRVDHFLSLIACVVLWIQMRNPFSLPRFAVIFSSISCLFLIKEVGFVLALTLLLVMVFDYLFQVDIRSKEKRYSLALCLTLFLYLLAQKLVWDNHCESLGFNQFHSGISVESLKAALNFPGSYESRHGVYLFLKNLTIGAADRLKLPYLLWYFFLGFLWFQSLKNYSSTKRSRYLRLFSITLPIYLLYLGMNYVMQFVIFGLGTSSESTTSLDRYVNIFFCWLILFTLTTVIVDRFTSGKPVISRWPAALIVVAALLLVGSSTPKKSKQYELEIANLLRSVENHIESGSRVCITPGDIEKHYLGFRFLYYLLPSSFNVDSFPGSSGKNGLAKKLLNCDYLLVYLPDETTGQMFSSFTPGKIEHQGLFEITPAQQASDPPMLERLY